MEKTMQQLSQQYSGLCTKLGNIMTNIDLLTNDLNETKAEIMKVNAEALIVKKAEAEAKAAEEVKTEAPKLEVVS